MCSSLQHKLACTLVLHCQASAFKGSGKVIEKFKVYEKSTVFLVNS